MKNILLLILIIYVNSCFGQERQYLDFYIPESGDTIYGTFRSGLLKTYLYEEVDKNAATADARFAKHEVKGGMGCRYNGCFIAGKEAPDAVYRMLMNPADKPELGEKHDYIIIATHDTLYGEVVSPALSTPYIKLKGGDKLKIKEGKVLEYKQGSNIYEYRDKPRAYNFDRKQAFLLRLVHNGTIKLYGYKDENGPCYFIEKDKKLFLAYNGNYIDVVEAYMADNATLVRLVKVGIYGFENMVLIVNYYNGHK